ncbi:MAG: argininosuccinate lyase [Planctomycetota bacterium]|jgi:argininosuccinate lyase
MKSATHQLWGGRFQGGLAPAFEAFNQSLSFDCALLQVDLQGSAAWARALGGAGVLEADEVRTLEQALEELQTEFAADSSALGESNAEDIHGFVEAALEERVGSLARKLHTGRSRNDQVATDLRLYMKTRIESLLIAQKALVTALADLAEKTADLALPGYTHLQRAQPVTVGHQALAYAEMLLRDASRLRDARTRFDVCPLGSGALAGTAWPVDRESLATDLGFARASANSLDAVSSRDHAAEVAFACAQSLVHLSRLAEDWIFHASQEAGFLKLGDSVCTGSSLMPQKKNPDALELVRGKCARVIGDLQTLLVMQKGLPLAYDKDLQEDKEALFDALDTTEACLVVTELVVRDAHYDRERAHAACQSGHLDATDLADLLVTAGIPFRDAHERVGAAVRVALEENCTLGELSPERQKELWPELDTDLKAALSTEALLARRDVLGGTAPNRVKDALQTLRKELSSWEK